MNTGKSIKIALAQRDWTQRMLAEKLGITEVAVSHLAKGTECSGSRLRSLAKAFNLKVSEFVELGEIHGEDKNSKA